MPGRSYEGPLEPLSEHESALRDQLKAHVLVLAGAIGERNVRRYQALNAAADYVSQQFREIGYTVREQTFAVEGKTVKNFEAELRGKLQPQEIIVFGAHYDSVAGSPGANDNASGVAALLALARLANQQRFARTVRFVAFVNEELPYFQTRHMGSRVYARECAQRGERIAAMLSLETIGYYSDTERSQSYPFPFSFFYPNTGNFIAFVGNLGSRDLVREIVAVFRKHTQFPSEGVAAPGIIPGISWSDQWSFWEEGYRAVMVTDTAFYRYGQYHTLRDTPEIIDYERMTRVVAGLGHVLGGLAGLEEH
jgi:Zn-dependent M28 family amino/carboxypeptidase